MSPILTDCSDQALVAAIEANWFEFGNCVWVAPLVEVHRETDVVWYRSRLRSPLLNGIAGAQFAADDAEDRIDGALAHFTPQGLPASWRIGPTTQPAHLDARLRAHGLRSAGEEIGMSAAIDALRSAGPLPAGVQITGVTERDQLADWMGILAAAFGFRPFEQTALFELEAAVGLAESLPYRRYVASLYGKPIAGAALLLGAGVAGIYNVGVLAEARGRGIASALTVAMLDDARMRGYRIAVLHASPGGRHVYERLGFQEYCRISRYLLAGA